MSVIRNGVAAGVLAATTVGAVAMMAGPANAVTAVPQYGHSTADSQWPPGQGKTGQGAAALIRQVAEPTGTQDGNWPPYRISEGWRGPGGAGLANVLVADSGHGQHTYELDGAGYGQNLY